MRKQATIIPLHVFTIDPTSPEPIHRQLYSSLRHAILSRQLSPGTQLPSTCMLASELGLARGTVVNAFSQLFAEGYLESKHGGGTYIARELPDDLLQIPSAKSSEPRPEQANRTLSQRGRAMTSIHFPPIEPPPNNGLLLGYTTFHEEEIRAGVQQLAAALRSISL